MSDVGCDQRWTSNFGELSNTQRRRRRHCFEHFVYCRFSLLLLLLQNSLCLRDFRVFVNFYVCVRTICMCARAAVLYVCVGSQLRGGAVVKRTSVWYFRLLIHNRAPQFHTRNEHFGQLSHTALFFTFPWYVCNTHCTAQLHTHSAVLVLDLNDFRSEILPGNPGNGSTCQRSGLRLD